VLRTVEPLSSGSELADSPLLHDVFLPVLYAGCPTTAFLQHSRIHTRMS